MTSTDAAQADAGLTIRGVSKAFGRSAALERADLVVGEGELLALLGPSGSGKTTLLRVLAGLETPDAGEVTFKGRDLLAQNPRERRIGMVFQHYALFRHMTVAQNIGFGLRVRPRKDRPSKADIAARAEELLRLVKLEGYGKRFPSELSGGQRQRVAFARALAIDPQLLLLDEPFGALDAQVRGELRRWLREVHHQTGVTTVLVTHDQEEALETADRIAVMNAGRVLQSGAPEAVYADPADAFVFGFLGGEAKLPVRLDGERAWFGDHAVPHPRAAGEGVAHVRPEDLQIAPDGTGLPARIVSVRRVGPWTRAELTLDAGGPEFEAVLPAVDADTLRAGEAVRVRPRRFRIYG